MKIKYFDTEIDCTVDEFEDMIARGIFKSKIKPEEFIQDLIPKNPRPAPSWPETVALYGCQVPADKIKIEQPLVYQGTTKGITTIHTETTDDNDGSKS